MKGRLEREDASAAVVRELPDRKHTQTARAAAKPRSARQKVHANGRSRREIAGLPDRKYTQTAGAVIRLDHKHAHIGHACVLWYVYVCVCVCVCVWVCVCKYVCV